MYQIIFVLLLMFVANVAGVSLGTPDALADMSFQLLVGQISADHQLDGAGYFS